MMAHIFYIGAVHSDRAWKLDVSTFTSLQALQSILARRFGFSDANFLCFYSKTHGPLPSLSAIQASTTPIEIRATQQPDTSIREPPGPEPLPIVGNHYEIYPDPLGNYDRLFARYGPMIKTVNMGTTIYHTNDPEVARAVQREGDCFTKITSDPSHPLYYMSDPTALLLCDSDAPSFAVSHKFLPPALSPRAMAHYAPLIQGAAKSIFSLFDELSEQRRAFNVYQFMLKMGGQVIWRVVIGQDVKHFEKLDTPPTLAMRLFGEYLRLAKKTSLKPKWYGYLPFGDVARLRVVRTMLRDMIGKAMEEAVTPDSGTLSLADPAASLKAANIVDFLSRAVDEEGAGMPQDFLLSNVTVLLAAGFTTTASLLSWCLYSLVTYPGNQERLLQELIDHGAASSKIWTYEEIHGMKFLDTFVKETQRMHSPSFQVARNALKDVILPGGYLIPAGGVVIPCFPSMHKNPLHWDNPQRFDADRWVDTGAAAKARRNGLYTPFSAGERGCIGFNLALTEVKIVLAELVYRYHFEDSSAETVVYDPEFLVVRPLNFYASSTKRTEWPQTTITVEKV